MIPAKIEGATINFKGNGSNVHDMHFSVTAYDDCYVVACAWTPTPAELEKLNAGGNIIVSQMVFNQPPRPAPIRVDVSEPPQEAI